MTLDALRRSPLFAPLGERLRARNARALSDGVPVTAVSGGGVSPMRFALRFGAFVSLVAFLALSPLPDALSIAPALALLALAWFVLALFLFRSDFRIGMPAATDSLMGFIRSARLYTEEKVLDGNRRDTGIRRVADSVRLVYFLEYPMLRVRALDDVAWHKAVGQLDALGLPAALGLPLDSKVSAVTHVDYLFRVVQDERIRAVPRLLPSAPAFTGVRDAVPLTGSLSWRFSKLPHMLVAGGTGGGKSTFIYYLLGEFLRLGDADGGAGDVFICDPKNAELASLSCVFGTDRVGVSPAQIAGVVRRCREEMDRRYAYMQDPARFRFGASAFDYGLPPVFLIFDEVAAFKAGADSKTFAEVWANLTQLVLKARAANVFVILAMQQPRAETIPTDIRDNLGARVSLGNLSAEGYRMCFGNGFADYQTVTERGTGYIMLDGWDAPRPFKAPFADYSGIDYPKELKRLYIAAQRRNGVSADTDQKDESAESVSE